MLTALGVAGCAVVGALMGWMAGGLTHGARSVSYDFMPPMWVPIGAVAGAILGAWVGALVLS
jgi:hypothetical protein